MLVVVGLAGDDLVGPEQLLEQDHPRQLMGQGDGPQREVVVGGQLQPVWASHGEAEIGCAAPPLLQEAAELDRVQLLSVSIQQRCEGPFWQPSGHPLVVLDLDQLEAHMAGKKLLVVLHVVGKRGPCAAYGDYHDPHDGILGGMDDQERSERRINIHFSPEIMAGSYANFANVSHSDYEFTITFARVDHEVEDEEIPGVVVSRINLSAKFMRELIDAMNDNYSKWETREGIKNLPEFGGSEGGPEPE